MNAADLVTVPWRALNRLADHIAARQLDTGGLATPCEANNGTCPNEAVTYEQDRTEGLLAVCSKHADQLIHQAVEAER